MIKKKFQRLMALMLSGALAFGLTACGGNGQQTAQTPESPKTAESAEEKKTDAAEKQTGSEETPVLFESAYGSKKEALQAGLDLNVRIAEEGMILFKNEGSALPLAGGAKVTLLGYAAIDPNAGASRNVVDASGGAAIAQATIISGMEKAGFALNKTVLDSYTKWADEEVEGAEADEKGNVPKKNSDILCAQDFTKACETEEWKASLKEYSDAALVVIADGTGEIAKGGRVHSLQLDQQQYALIDYAAANFDKVIVLVNSCTPTEIADIQRNAEVDAILNIGEPGDNGFEALGKVIAGEVNPSGRTVDTWAVDFTKNPSYTIFNTRASEMAQGEDGKGTMTGYTRYSVNGEPVNTWSVGY